LFHRKKIIEKAKKGN